MHSGDGFGAILGASRGRQGLSPARVAAVCEVLANHDEDDVSLWNRIAELPGFDDRHVGEARRLVMLGTVAAGHAPTVAAILSRLGTGPAEEVATWPTSVWKEVADGIASLPDGLDGTDDAARRARLATLLEEHAAVAFPATALRSALTGPSGAALGVDAILARPANAALDLHTAKLHPGAGVALDPQHAEAELDALRRAQRLARIVPRLGVARTLGRLGSLGIASAQDVVRRGRSRFTRQYTDGAEGLREEALAIFRRARNQAAMAQALFLSAHPSLTRMPLSFVPGREIEVSDDQIPGFSDLFEAPAGTRCGWCDSIHGPSAYLVDLLGWLADRTAPDGSAALVRLLDRRPDLAALPLSCENAERTLPCTDLVLEVLEAATAGEPDPPAHSSTTSPAEMLAAPQYTNEQAYVELGTFTQSFETPFHRPLVEARAFLAHLGVDRTDLMRAFVQSGSPTAAEIAFEELGLSVEGAGAITDNGTEQAYWTHDLGAAVTVHALHRSAGLTYPETLDLLHLQSSHAALDVARDATANPYDTASYRIQQPDGSPPTPETYARLRKLLRLRRATGWSLLALDRVLGSLGETEPLTWDDDTLLRVAGIHRLARETALDPVELAACETPSVPTPPATSPPSSTPSSASSPPS